MSASLVGSEMCIRDRPWSPAQPRGANLGRPPVARARAPGWAGPNRSCGDTPPRALRGYFTWNCGSARPRRAGNAERVAEAACGVRGRSRC
eukprot:15368077-Alexandrium_andersonii.AAC.1